MIGKDLVGWFMWMHAIELSDGTVLHAYKHVATRRYFHLAEHGVSFIYTRTGRYRRITRRAAIAEAFKDWRTLSPRPRDRREVEASLRRVLAAADVADRAAA